MFVIPCKFTQHHSSLEESYVARSIASIRVFHPNEKILIVDSDSEDTTYLKRLGEISNVIADPAENRNYIDGALWYAYNKYPNEEWYCLLQDTITLKHSFDEFINGESLFYSLMWFSEVMTGPRELEYLDEMYEKHLKNYRSKRNSTVVGCWGPCFVAKKEILDRLKNNNLDKCVPNDKFGSNVTERLWGMCLEAEGIDIKKNTIDGNFLEIALPREGFNSKTKYHKKTYGGRQ